MSGKWSKAGPLLKCRWRAAALVGVVVVMIDYECAEFVAARLIRRFEGLSLAPYLCPAGLPTIGYGHVILPSEAHFRGGITLDDAEALLTCDLAWAMRAARDVGRVLTNGQAAALASLIYNIGAQAWATSSIRGMVMAGDMRGAAAQFGRWNKAGGKVLPGLVNRRQVERRVFEGCDDGMA